MKIRHKVLLVVGGLFALLGGAQFLVQQQILLPSFADLERRGARTDMDRVANTIDRELDLLSITARDYGNWIDSYEFMRDRNAEYIDINLTEDSIATLRVNVMAFIDLEGNYAWKTGREIEGGNAIDIDLLSGRGLPGDHPWRAAVSKGTATSGLLMTNHGAMLAVVAPILDGTGQGPHRGILLLGRLMTDREVARIGQQAQVRLSQLAPAAGEMPTATPSEQILERETVTEVVRQFSDVAGAPALWLKIEVPRTISARGFQVVASATAFMIATGAVVLLLTILMLNRTVLGPLADVTRHAVRVGQSDDLTARLDLERADELGELAREFDRMVSNLAEARRQLVDQSFDAGVAENASGVLHNLGNAMTPLSVKVAGLQESLLAAPLADMELVMAELAQGIADPARKADLEEFLRLTSTELARVVGEARRDIESLAQQTHAIQQILTDQGQCSRAARVVDTVWLPDLLEQSAELVSPELRGRLSIQADASLTEIGAVRVARTALQQVFQNLIVNAAEAIRDAGLERGLLRVSVTSMTAPDGEQMDICFADNGAGIAASHLALVFDKGFSTKSKATNQGIGLHWCANTINALGGRMRAESAGENRGASIHVVMPLERVAVPISKVA